MDRGQSILMVVLFTSSVVARVDAADSCISGYVWREAFPGDHVCVTPATRAAAAEDNRLAAERREPHGGAYGPNTCRPGFVWREAQRDDYVCVTPETRTQTASDNRMEKRRYSGQAVVMAPTGGITRAEAVAAVQPPVEISRPVPDLSSAPPSAGGSVKRGFDDEGRPYVEETLGDGSIRREQSNGVTVIKPDGTREFYRKTFMMAQAPYATPPNLPIDPGQGRAWVSRHNDQLRDLIELLVDRDQSEMQKFTAAESKAVGSDLFEQIEYRTQVLQTLATL